MHGNEINNKRFYWLKLDRNFFKDARIKKLRKLAGGDTYTIIYLKMMLLSIEKEGIIVYEGIEDDFANEVALKIDEDNENVKVTVQYLISQGMLEERNGDAFLPQAHNSIGSETYNNVYKKSKNLENGWKNSNQIPTSFQPSSNQIPIEKEIEIDIEKDIKENNKKKSKFSPPSVEEVMEYCKERNNSIDPQAFVDFYESKGWKVGNQPMKDWKAAIRTWEKRNRGDDTKKKSSGFDLDGFFNDAVNRG